MSATQEALVAAALALEDAMVNLAAARSAYGNAYRVAHANRFRAHAGGPDDGIPHATGTATARVAELNFELGAERIDRLLAGRLRGLGLGGVVGRGDFRVSPTWLTTVTDRIRRLVP